MNLQQRTSSLGRRSIISGALGATAAASLASIPAAQAADRSPSGRGHGHGHDHDHHGRCPLPTEGRDLVAAAPGGKWDIEGNALRFRGNTFVYPVPQDSAFFAAQTEAQELVAGSCFADHFALLPHNSMHMTLFDGTNQIDRDEGIWPKDVDPGADLTEATQGILALLQDAELEVPDAVTMRVTGVKDLISDSAAPSVLLTGADRATETALRNLRDQLSALTGIRQDNFDSYAFHSTMGYRLVAARKNEHRGLKRLERKMLDLFVGRAATVTLEPVAFNAFEDMLAFPQLHLL